MGLGKVLPKSWSTNWAKKTKFTLVKSSGTLLLFKRWPKAKEIRLLMTLGLGKGWPVARLTRNWLTPSKKSSHRKIDFLFNTFQSNLSNLLVEVLSMAVPSIPNAVSQESDYYRLLNEVSHIGDHQRSCSSIRDSTPKDLWQLGFASDNFRAFFGWVVRFG